MTKKFHDLVWPHRADVLRFAQFLCRDRSVAEDLAQETLLKAFRALSNIATMKDLKSWLLVILRNTWLDRLRASRVEMNLRTFDEQHEVEAIAGTESTDFWKDPQSLIDAFADQEVIDALRALPEEIRWTLLLLDVEGLSVQETTDILSVPLARERRWIRDATSPNETNLRQEEK